MKMEIVSHNDEHHFLKQIFWDVIIALHKNYDLRKKSRSSQIFIYHLMKQSHFALKFNYTQVQNLVEKPM